ncbi:MULTISPECIES: hypothetical protein [unclassified Methanoregula]|uniref:hypothetical protein n=1 Tax=unclassified Methanoregula TaxID=2649730 RepID=UPI0009D5C834|nr:MULTISPECIES: hypothetical protein [unclassified Methanoregula]OPX65301.1 MAG: hypothetical protein A4E33_00334 [Methanoregula sp. PtaB.Bin085]OPY32210.1 MAG: hypothetical protein A4E34_02584 [Methanoregula sp. PtaU1.Bin006]
MAAKSMPERGKKSSRSRGPPGVSQDRKRDILEARHHPSSHARPHPAHHPRHKVTGTSRHYPHTHPPEEALDIDHGTHQDRPRPGKIAKKSRRL